MIKGITVILCGRTKTGEDPFHAPIYTETEIPVKDVLVTPTASEEVISETQLYGKRSAYELFIPKGDTNDWENKTIKFFGQTFHSFGPVTQYIEANVPLRWNKKVKVEQIE